MRRFLFAVIGYVLVCLTVAGIIVLRGDGPHPRIISVYPTRGDQYWPGGILEITFSQPMDQASVERGLEVSPGSQGQGAWYGDTLNLQPVEDWRPGVTYHVRLVGTISDAQGRPLRTPVDFWFRVHHIHCFAYCTLGGVRNVCERTARDLRPVTHAPTLVLAYALSSDRSELAFIRRDGSGLPHLFVEQVDGTDLHLLTHGTSWADSHPLWPYGSTSSITYTRQPAHRLETGLHLGRRQVWNVNVDGSNNARL